MKFYETTAIPVLAHSREILALKSRRKNGNSTNGISYEHGGLHIKRSNYKRSG
jgi:hypothetical protein